MFCRSCIFHITFPPSKPESFKSFSKRKYIYAKCDLCQSAFRFIQLYCAYSLPDVFRCQDRSKKSWKIIFYLRFLHFSRSFCFFHCFRQRTDISHKKRKTQFSFFGKEIEKTETKKGSLYFFGRSFANVSFVTATFLSKFAIAIAMFSKVTRMCIGVCLEKS